MTPSRFETVLFEVRGGIASIRLNRPHRLNAVVERLYEELLDALAAAETDRDVRVVVLGGEGRAFCVGADLKEHGRGARTDLEKRRYLIKANDACRRLRASPLPIVAAVNGYALGAGAELAVACDFILMNDSAEIGFPEVSIGTFLGGGVTHVLPQLVGLSLARTLIFTGRRVGGREAKAIGLATDAFADDAFARGVDEFAATLAAKAPLSMALAKAHLNAAAAHGYETALVTELEGIRACMATRDWQEGVDAFAQKRPPAFKGE
jgi:enoyl-CoA hydratase